MLPQICHSAYLPLALPFVWSNLRGFSPPHKLVDLYMLTYSQHLLTGYALRCNPVGSIAVGSNLHMHAANFTHSPVLYVHQLSQPPIRRCYRPCCQDTKRASVHTHCVLLNTNITDLKLLLAPLAHLPDHLRLITDLLTHGRNGQPFSTSLTPVEVTYVAHLKSSSLQALS